MARSVVHALQIIQVGECHEQRFVAAAREAEIPRRERQEAAPVVQARQIVHEREVQERRMEPVPLDREPEGVGEDRTVDLVLHEEVLRPGAHRFEAVTLVLGVREKEKRYLGRQRTQLGEDHEAAAGGERHGEKHDVDSALRQAGERCLRRRGGHAEPVRIGGVQEGAHAPGFVLLVAHHQHDELVAARLDLAPTRGLAAIGGPAALGLVAPLLVERDDFQATLARTALAVIAAGRQDPPVVPVVLLPSAHSRACCDRCMEDGGQCPRYTIDLTASRVVVTRAPTQRAADSEPWPLNARIAGRNPSDAAAPIAGTSRRRLSSSGARGASAAPGSSGGWIWKPPPTRSMRRSAC